MSESAIFYLEVSSWVLYIIAILSLFSIFLSISMRKTEKCPRCKSEAISQHINGWVVCDVCSYKLYKK